MYDADRMGAPSQWLTGSMAYFVLATEGLTGYTAYPVLSCGIVLNANEQPSALLCSFGADQQRHMTRYK